MKENKFSKEAAFIHNLEVKNYCLETPFDPPEAYCEIPFIRKTNNKNTVYPMVRELLKSLGMDRENIGTNQWNPFKYIIKPGNKVLIKPNLVTPEHYLGEKARYSIIVHGSIIRPIVDYVALALNGKGSIIVADNPLDRADFELIMEFTGIQAMVDELIKYGYADLRVIDLRPKVLKEARNGKPYYEFQPGDPLGYVTIDLGKYSLFAEFDNDTEVHYYTLADHTVNHLDPKCERESTTDRYHNSTMHKYVVSKSVLDADVIIDVAKMKTHCKAGVTLALKNMIGMVYLKDCMPHHRPGSPPKGDSFPHVPASHYVAIRRLYRNFRNWFQIHRFPGFRFLRNYMQKNKILISQHIEHGNWKGNDTIWRTILDLNRIALYADKDGRMRDIPQRKFFSLIDGIVAQQGDGPMCGEPVISSIILGGFNPVIVDALAVKSMGINPQLIRSISKASKIDRWKLIHDSNFNVLFPAIDVPNLNFNIPKGWVYR